MREKPEKELKVKPWSERTWVLFAGLKVTLFAFVVSAVALLVSREDARAAEDAPKASSSEASKAAQKEGEESPPLPAIPKDLSSLSEAERIRVNLELVRRDAEAKLKALAKARQAYERSKREVDARLKEVKEQKSLLDETLQKEKETKAERLKDVLVFIEKMEPRKSAPLVESMDRDLVIALFKKLPSRVVTRILENVSPRKATELMEYYTRLRSGREFAMLRELGLCQPPASEDEDSAPGSNPKTQNETTGEKTGDDDKATGNAAAKTADEGKPVADAGSPAK
jgi:flagellar motility protein MotE (MotC chaperone)